jgi:abortive infection bacteriophage resistance protein
MNKPAYSISDRITLLKHRGLLFRDEKAAARFLKNTGYYRLKGYWWNMQSDYTLHTFNPGIYFEDVTDRYHFDRRLRLILFDAVERIEIALRTKMIYHLSIAYGGLWYLDSSLFENATVRTKGIIKTVHQNTIDELQKEFNRSREIFIKDHRSRYPNQPADAWKTLEVASLGTLSKLYKNLKHQLPEKAAIANEMGLNFHNELSGWLEAISSVRNIIAHHSRLWNMNMSKKPTESLNNPKGLWFNNPLTDIQKKKAFLTVSCMLYLCNEVAPGHRIKTRIHKLIDANPSLPVYKIGFFNDWRNEPLWK